jgi:two-component system sensor histidine kinase PilS (NtrC family)
MTINRQGKIKSFNRAAEEISGLTFAEVENRNIVEIFPNFVHIKKITQEDYKSSIKNRYNLEFTSKGNKNLILGCSVSVLKDNKDKRIGDILIFQDLTSIRKMEEALEKNKRLAIIGEMAAGLAHEMRNPLASISGSIQVLRKDIKLTAMDERLMQIILRGKDQLENIIKDFLLLARPIQGNQQVIIMSEVIEDVVESVQYIPDWNENITISLSLTDNLTIYANKAEMREVIWNLILNSVQAMPDGGVLSIDAKKRLSDSNNEFLEIKISDTGYGIDEKYMNKIFEPFFTTKEKGTGLGLAIVNKIVEGYAGTTKIESNVERGTTFSITLPIH